MDSKLTKNQKQELQNLETHGRLYVGYNSPEIMRTFDALVRKGYALEHGGTLYGKYYKAAN